MKILILNKLFCRILLTIFGSSIVAYFLFLVNFDTMGFFKKGYRGYDYQPRYYKSDKDGNPFKIEYKFDQYRTTAGSNRGLKNKFNNVLEDSKRAGDRNVWLRMIIITSVLLIIFLYIIDFDLSIFFAN